MYPFQQLAKFIPARPKICFKFLMNFLCFSLRFTFLSLCFVVASLMSSSAFSSQNCESFLGPRDLSYYIDLAWRSGAREAGLISVGWNSPLWENLVELSHIWKTVLVSRKNNSRVVILRDDLVKSRKLDFDLLEKVIGAREFGIVAIETNKNQKLWINSGSDFLMKFGAARSALFFRIITLGFGKRVTRRIPESLDTHRINYVELNKDWSPKLASQIGHLVNQLKGWIGVAGSGILILGVGDHILAVPGFSREAIQAMRDGTEIPFISDLTPLAKMGIYEPIKDGFSQAKEAISPVFREYRMLTLYALVMILGFKSKFKNLNKYVPGIAFNEDKASFIADRINSLSAHQVSQPPMLVVLNGRRYGLVREELTSKYDFKEVPFSEIKSDQRNEE